MTSSHFRLRLLIVLFVVSLFPYPSHANAAVPVLAAAPAAPVSAAPAAPAAAARPRAVLSTQQPQLASSGPALTLAQSVSQEPLLGGAIGYTLTISNTGASSVADRGYNLTISDTLPVGLSFTNATPTPTLVSPQANGTTLLAWDNIADLEAGEALSVQITAALSASLTPATSFVNLVSAKINTAPDNSGSWVSQSSQLAARAQAIDINTVALPSTAARQANGAGEYGALAPGQRAGADWPYQYRVTVKNNAIGQSTNAIATVTLPPGVAFLNNVTISPNPNGVATTPVLTLRADGALDLRWSLGTLTTARYADPVVITFVAAIPYRFRSAADTAAASGPFAGPMHGAIIPDATALPVLYEASASYAGLTSTDGTQSTPADDSAATVTAAYATISKAGTPSVVGIGSEVTWTLRWYVSEYYTATNVIVTDVLPDGLTYVDGSASRAPTQVQPNTPSVGQTTITWELPANTTTAGQQDAITLRASVDPTYEAAPIAGQPVVSGDTLTNRATLNGDWQDGVTAGRTGALTPTKVRASVDTRTPVFTKQVWEPISGSWAHAAKGFTGDTMRFRLTFAAAADVDAKGIVIRDFLPRGMTYVNSSATHTTSGTFANGRRWQGDDGGRRQRRVRRCAGAGDGRHALWHGQARAKIRDAGQGRRRRQAVRGRAGRVPGQLGRAYAGRAGVGGELALPTPTACPSSRGRA